MQNFHNGRTPAGNADMPDAEIQELADKLSTLVRRSGGRGLRIPYHFLSGIVGDASARAALERAGFHRMPETWTCGRGNSIVADWEYPPVFADALEEIWLSH